MSSLINNAMSGLNAAQAALNTASNNISSYNVAGYTRQTTIMAQANSTLGAGGWVGNGVYVSGVQREYDAFITNQLRAAQTQSSGLTSRYEQMSKIDNMLSAARPRWQHRCRISSPVCKHWSVTRKIRRHVRR